jgi:branched-chain amino acid transport system ATP-binding protein
MNGRAEARGGVRAAALEARGLRKNFGAAEIIRGVDLVIPKGERHAVIGPNGAGKSTLST